MGVDLGVGLSGRTRARRYLSYPWVWRPCGGLVGMVRTRGSAGVGSGGGELLMESVGRRGECMLNKLIRYNQV
jgi:hypothetical protein